MCINVTGSKEGSVTRTEPPLPPDEKETKTDGEKLSELKEGPLATVLESSKSSLALASRRRQLIDSFKYGFSGTVNKKTNLDVPITKAEGELQVSRGRRKLKQAVEYDEDGSIIINTTAPSTRTRRGVRIIRNSVGQLPKRSRRVKTTTDLSKKLTRGARIIRDSAA